MKEIRFNSEALAEYEELFQEFSRLSVKLADRFEIQVVEFTRLIAANPSIFHAGRYGVARANLQDGFHRYYLAYLDAGEFVNIVAVGTAERRPYYFKNRLGQSGR